ncbi:MAG: Gfo/Idh/MocA family oxidoreductase [Flammeovirgaceae bacterium]
MNILIVGLGTIAKKHIEALRLLNIEANLYALRSTKNPTNILGVKNIYSNEQLSIQFDFVIISNPTHLHYKIIKNFATHGTPLFIEKPFVHTLDNIDNLLKLVKKNNLITYVACNLRFHPCIIYLKNKLDFKFSKINEVNVYCGSYLPDWRPSKDFRATYSANKKMGGGVHLDLFHEFDYTTWLFGLPKKSKSVLRNVSSLNIDAFDYANYILEYDSFTTSIILNYFRKKPKREIEIVFEDKTWTIDLIHHTIKDDGIILFEASEFKIEDTYYLQLNYFINCLKQSKLPMNDIKESSEILKIVLKNEK